MVIFVPNFLAGLSPNEELHVLGHKRSNDDILPVNDETNQGQGCTNSVKKSDCTICPLAQLQSLNDLRAHFKSEWHIYNLKARQAEKPVISEAECLGRIRSPPAEESSSSSAESEETDDVNAGSPFLRFAPSSKREEATCYEVYKASVLSNEEFRLRYNDMDYLKNINVRGRLSNMAQANWLILLMRSGRVACALFDNESATMMQCKTFKRYTVRRKQGGSQLARDSAGSGRTKSAGANIRRKNELHLIEDVHRMLSEWRDQVSSCSLIFWNPTMTGRLCLNDSSVLKTDDVRLRSIPFTTYRPSLEEIQRCYKLLVGVNKCC